LLIAVGLCGALSTSLFAGCGDEERPHAPLPDAGDAGTGTSSGFDPSTSSAGGSSSDGGASSASTGTGASAIGGGGSGGEMGDCANGVQDGAEPDIDCGATCPNKCDPGSACMLDLDCSSFKCVNDKCLTPTCTDLVNNGEESDVDCGGPSCGPCAAGKSCVDGQDCVTGVCDVNQQCTFAVCNDGVKNGTETGIDCGGPACPKCPNGEDCTVASDCQNGFCKPGNPPECATPTCSDGYKNGTETDVDCGGTCGATCAVGKTCSMGGDCVVSSSSCVNGKCAPPTCVDMIKNGSETGKDCGGPNCGDCPANESCLSGADCLSLVCSNNICQPPSCGDAVKNGNETDTDCGGICSQKCALGKFCGVAADCIGGPSANCVTGKCACPPGMIIVPIAGEGTYCIDQTEVSYNEYLAFYQANPAGPQFKPDPQCSSNLNYTPLVGWPPPANQLTYPVVAMDWCDAYAYCAYVGKRLCGHIGGGPNPFTEYDDHAQSEWHNACTANGENLYPYGDGYLLNACQGEGDTSSVEVKSLASVVISSPTCIGGISPFLYHMSGNVEEWENSCESTAAGAQCHVRGGSFGLAADANMTTLQCNASASDARTGWAADRGFRCCL
jgi:hypothetical protein